MPRSRDALSRRLVFPPTISPASATNGARRCTSWTSASSTIRSLCSMTWMTSWSWVDGTNGSSTADLVRALHDPPIHQC